MFGEGKWVWCDNCATAPNAGANGVPIIGAYHHVNFHTRIGGRDTNG